MATILETLVGDPNYSILVALAVEVDDALDAGIVEALGDPDFGSTIFAPTDGAMISAANSVGYPGSDAAGAAVYLVAAANALSDGEAAQFFSDVLLYHVTPSELTSDDLTEGAVFETLLGTNLSVASGALVDVDPGSPNAQLGEVSTFDNGVVVPIDQLLLPVVIELDEVGTEGADIVVGSDEDDEVFLFGDLDVFSGGGGNDTADGGPGSDLLFGGEGDDSLVGGQDFDWLSGGQGEDTLRGGDGEDLLEGGLRDDSLFGGNQEDLLIGDKGNDLLAGQNGSDELRGDGGADRVFGGAGDDTGFGGGGDDILVGGLGNDRLAGGNGADSLYGGAGFDDLFGGADDDLLVGKDGDDLLEGDGGNDRLFGGRGNDELRGEAGADRLVGGGGADSIDGGADADFLSAGAGNDTLTGGEGQDTYFFATGANGANRITDYNASEDRLELSNLDDDEVISILLGQGDGNDALLVSSMNENWSLLVEDAEDLSEDDLNLI
ncbi:MAG: fasciclin domain-containing protein [Pseudomonadota bacterium]